MSIRVIKNDFNGLDMFVRSLSMDNVVRVGVLGNKATRGVTETIKTKKGINRVKGKEISDMSNADVGALHELGSISKKIPVRSWLYMPLRHEGEKIIAECKESTEEALTKGNIKLALKRFGIACENAIQRAFASRGFGKWKENAPLTKIIKGSDSPLIDTGQLRRSVSSEVV